MSGSSLDRDTLVERVVGIRPDGIELEYDLPKQVTAQARESQWQFPARVLKTADGQLRLLNEGELENRVGAWLDRAKLLRASCGHSYFTWNVFRIECDPASVLRTLQVFDLRPRGIGDGAPYMGPGAGGPTMLKQVAHGSGGATFVGVATVDADQVRREQAEGDVAVAEINKQTVSLEDAFRTRAAEEVSGTTTITFYTDSTGLVRKRERLTRLDIKDPNGKVETRTIDQTAERRPTPRR